MYQEEIDVAFRERSDSGTLVFAKKSEAELTDAVYKALENSQTWDELKMSMPSGQYDDVLRRYVVDHPKPRMCDSFDARSIPGYEDMTYPEWLSGKMLAWFPQEIIDKYGPTEWTSDGRECLYLPVESAGEIVKALQVLGYQVEHRPDLTFD